MRIPRKALAAAGPVALVTLLLLMPFPASWEGAWQSKCFDLGHVPLFATLTICLWLVLGRSWLWPPVIALALAALTELVQDWFGRNGSLLDFVRGALGVAAAMVALHAWEGSRSLTRLALHALAIVALVAWPVADAAPWLLDAWEGWRAFPTVADFATERQLLRWRCNEQATLQRIPDPEQPSGALAQLDFLPGSKPYSGVEMEPIVRDWRGQRHLCCSFTVAGEPPLIVVFSIRGYNAQEPTSNFQEEKTYAAGTHVVRINLEAAAPRARNGPLNLAHIRRLVVFTYAPDRPRTVVLHRVWLE
ncbi:MAG TPA: hypothetical protein VEL76_41955 [Gemmataceae bacterium]|nr:hypothetical protein [Gemmataceae bacterium]